MKNQILKLTASMALRLGFAMLFARCESNNAEMAQLEAMSMAAPAANDGAAAAMQYDATKVCECLTENFAWEEPDGAEEAALLFMREEEKLARDVYLNLFEKWNTRIFSNIAKAEQRHMDAVGCLLTKYNLADPVGDDVRGEFVNPDLQALYSSLMTQGNLSLKDALLVGAAIEDLDIADLMKQMDEADNADILAVFGVLNKGSRNHLRAFHRNLVRMGETYAPQNISQDLFDEIINSAKETGGAICGVCPGSGNGNANGCGNCPGICDGTGPHGNAGNGPGNGNGPGGCNGNGPQGNGGPGNGPGNGNCNGNGPHGNGPGNGNGPGGGPGGGNGPGGNGNGNGG